MRVVWAHAEPLTVADVHAALPEEARGAYTTTKTTMERLADKGILVQRRAVRPYHYEAAMSKEQLECRIVSTALDRLMERFPEAVASFFARPDSAPDEGRLALLREAIARRREELDG